MPFDGSDVYLLANRLGLPDLEQVAAQAGVMSVLQISAYYASRRVRHTVARVIEYQSGEIEIRLAYEGVSLEKPIRLAVENDNLEQIQAVLLKARFRKLSDQADLSYDERSLWLIQQAAGRHVHGIMVAPDRPELPYSTIVNAIDAYLPGAIREVPLRS
ncbi:MAG: hypothetical protein OXG78_11090 [Chloroflexi bacterium]|nr:hypothetical protein [Chloroflexota bacterium]